MDFALPLTHSSLYSIEISIWINYRDIFFGYAIWGFFSFETQELVDNAAAALKLREKHTKKDYRKRSLMICFVHLSLTVSSSFTWVLKNWWPILKFWCFFNCSYVKDVKMTVWLLLLGIFLFYLNEIGFVWELFHCTVGWSKIDTFFRCCCFLIERRKYQKLWESLP